MTSCLLSSKKTNPSVKDSTLKEKNLITLHSRVNTGLLEKTPFSKTILAKVTSH